MNASKSGSVDRPIGTNVVSRSISIPSWIAECLFVTLAAWAGQS
jgi:hypothetical protein